MTEISYRSMDLSEQGRFAEVDRTESIGQIYRQNGLNLERIDVDSDVPQWSMTEKLNEWEVYLQDDCVLWGAFANGKLVGFCGYRPSGFAVTGRRVLRLQAECRRKDGAADFTFHQ